MNAPAFLARTEPVVTFAAWRTSDETAHHEAHAICVTAATLSEAVEQAKLSCHHKDTLVILESDQARRKQTQHAYRIVRKAAKWVRDPVTGLEQRITPLDATPLFSMAVAVFEPVTPWRWSPGADVVGVDRTLLEVQ